MNANALAIGRNHSTADTLSVTTGSDWARVDIYWNDGAHISMRVVVPPMSAALLAVS